MRENRHLLFKIIALTVWTARFTAAHDKGFKFLAAGATDKIK
jgi:hypothetical protein